MWIVNIKNFKNEKAVTQVTAFFIVYTTRFRGTRPQSLIALSGRVLISKFCILFSLLLTSCQDPDAAAAAEARQVEGGGHAYSQKDVNTIFEDDFRP